jgi:hypothetical protein
VKRRDFKRRLLEVRASGDGWAGEALSKKSIKK